MGHRRVTAHETIRPRIRVRILKHTSRYRGRLGEVLWSNSDGTFQVRVAIEGGPVISLRPSELEPC